MVGAHASRSGGAGPAIVGLLALSVVAAPGRAQPLPARWPRAPLVEVARAQVRADEVTRIHGLTGDGGLLCVVDTGIDEARFGERVVARFDAFGAPTGDPLEAELGGAVGRPLVDRHGHGTAMAAIALGLAPGARLIVADAFDDALGGFPDEAVVRAVRFCRAAAAHDPALDPRRLVVLLSLGGHDGAHDGEGAFERALSAEAAVPIVVAAGNDGARPVHAGGRLFAGEEAVVEVRVPRPSAADPSLALTLGLAPEGPGADAWLETADGARSRSLTDPTERSLEAVGGISLERDPEPDREGVTRLVLRPAGETLPSGTHRIVVRGPGRFDVWLAGARLGPTFFAPALGGPWVRADEAITIPATAPGLISVGATVSRASLGDEVEAGAPGEVAAWSSTGPTAGGLPAPDLVAPGGWIAAPLSADLDAGDLHNLVGGRPARLEDGRVAIRGTSPAAAVVAGALLLALELDPTLGPRARAHLVASAGDPGWTPRRGWGELDAARLVEHVRGARRPTPALAVGRPLAPGDRRLWLTARAPGERLLVALDGAPREVDVAGDVVTLALDPGRLTVGREILLEASLDGAPIAPVTVPVVADRGPVGLRPGGGCRAGGPGAPAPLGAGLVLLLLARRRRREAAARYSQAAE